MTDVLDNIKFLQGSSAGEQISSINTFRNIEVKFGSSHIVSMNLLNYNILEFRYMFWSLEITAKEI